MTAFLDRWRIHKAVTTLQSGGVIAYPTEAVYGLGCDPFNAKAVERLLEIKQRSPDKGLILVASHWDQIAPFIADVDPDLQLMVKKSWPGPITWLFPATEKVPQWIRGKHATVALRISAHPLIQALCDDYGHPIVSTSANIADNPPLRDYLSVKRQLGSQIDFILEGQVGHLTKPTEIRDVLTGDVLREGN